MSACQFIPAETLMAQDCYHRTAVLTMAMESPSLLQILFCSLLVHLQNDDQGGLHERQAFDFGLCSHQSYNSKSLFFLKLPHLRHCLYSTKQANMLR